MKTILYGMHTAHQIIYSTLLKNKALTTSEGSGEEALEAFLAPAIGSFQLSIFHSIFCSCPYCRTEGNKRHTQEAVRQKTANHVPDSHCPPLPFGWTRSGWQKRPPPAHLSTSFFPRPIESSQLSICFTRYCLFISNGRAGQCHLPLRFSE